jgi:hypothetical protein
MKREYKLQVSVNGNGRAVYAAPIAKRLFQPIL